MEVRREYDLTIDQAEADAIDRVLDGCQSTEMVILHPGAKVPSAATPTPTGDVDALALYDDNRNGRITCAEARAHGIAPVHRGHPAYQYMRDGDGDGVVCVNNQSDIQTEHGSYQRSDEGRSIVSKRGMRLPGTLCLLCRGLRPGQGQSLLRGVDNRYVRGELNALE